MYRDALIFLISILFDTTCFNCAYLTMKNVLPIFAEVNEKDEYLIKGNKKHTERTKGEKANESHDNSKIWRFQRI